MSKILNAIITFILTLALMIIGILNMDNLDNWINDFLSQTNDYLNTNDIIFIESDGKLIDETNKLEDSKISGEEYTFSGSIYPYYELLNTNAKNIYKQIYANAEKVETTFVPVEKITADELNESYKAVLYDHPELFWLENNYSYKYYNDGEIAQVILEFSDLINDFDNNKTKFENAVDKIYKEALSYSSELEREKYIHDTIIKNVEYNIDAKYSQSAYSALVNQESVCAGYAKAFQLIMIKLGYQTYYITGEANGGGHAWNIVYLNNNFYNVDLTWDDQKTIIYNYFNKTDSEIEKTHTRTENAVNLPLCNGSKYVIGTTTTQSTTITSTTTTTTTTTVPYIIIPSTTTNVSYETTIPTTSYTTTTYYKPSKKATHNIKQATTTKVEESYEQTN